MKNIKTQCCICDYEFTGVGHNPYPIKNKGKCCNKCNNDVITERFKRFYYGKGDIKYLGNLSDDVKYLEDFWYD